MAVVKAHSFDVIHVAANLLQESHNGLHMTFLLFHLFVHGISEWVERHLHKAYGEICKTLDCLHNQG